MNGSAVPRPRVVVASMHAGNGRQAREAAIITTVMKTPGKSNETFTGEDDGAPSLLVCSSSNGVLAEDPNLPE